jgi:hypothetical protein
MNESAKDRLFTLLFGGERELVNVKFCPGFRGNLTVDQLFGAAADALQQALAPGVVSRPPRTGRKAKLLRELLHAPK